jgi:hypothetical protein
MFDQNDHPTDEELIRLIDGEISRWDTHKARAHYAGCSVCQSRRLQIEQASSEFADLYSATITPRLPASSATRSAELKDRLTAASLAPSTFWPGQLARFAQHRPSLFMAAAVFVLAVIGIFRADLLFRGHSISVQQAIRSLPDHALTPGAIRSVSVAESCSQQEEDLDPTVSTSVRKIVFQEYGIKVGKSDDYQVDYLINPQLGGTNDVRNLWPEPYGSTVWNAHAKDALEDRLHRMVCENQIDLASAQRELATDWIAAYKKYFHTETPS